MFMAKIHGHNPTPNNTTVHLLLKCVLYTDTVMDIGQCFSVYVCMYEWLLRCVVTYLYRW